MAYDAGMIHVAMKLGNADTSLSALSHNILSTKGRSERMLITNTSPDALKAEVRARIRDNPGERWLILSGNTIAELDTPPVTFRQW